MTASLAFWTLALVDLLAVGLCAIAGVRRIRRADVRGHRRSMLTAASLVALFLVSYLLKLTLLGKEDLERWDARSRVVLYVHETAIAVMLLSGALAGALAWRFRRTALLETGGVASRDRRFHRRAGRVAVAAALLAFATASAMLAGMYARAAAS